MHIAQSRENYYIINLLHININDALWYHENNTYNDSKVRILTTILNFIEVEQNLIIIPRDISGISSRITK